MVSPYCKTKIIKSLFLEEKKINIFALNWQKITSSTNTSTNTTLCHEVQVQVQILNCFLYMPKWTSRKEKMNETLGNILNSFLQDCGISSIVALEIPLLQKAVKIPWNDFHQKLWPLLQRTLPCLAGWRRHPYAAERWQYGDIRPWPPMSGQCNHPTKSTVLNYIDDLIISKLW